MYDIWAFLLQTLTASGTAVLLLVVKWMFRDKLPPRWQFGIWGIVGISLLIPAGLGGRYVLFNWPLIVELIKSFLTGDYTFTHVYFPFPAIISHPQSIWDWVFAVYVAGVAVHLIRYTVSYIRLRTVLRQGNEASVELSHQIQNISHQYGLPACRVVTVPGLSSAFVCGVIKPILAVPHTPVDDKVILHELLHLKSRDTLWSILICMLRAIHWCNPLLIYCANQAGNDLEARCDQMVLDLLEGEDRRDYGRILLAMANDRYAKTPGATCVNNGGKNIRKRIESIARFKRYPVGMKLISICAAIILALPVIVGIQATAVQEYDLDMRYSLASARTTPCTTAAGAFDCYGKSVLDQNGVYRAMCAPESMQKELSESILTRWEPPVRKTPYWESGLPCWPNSQEGYYIYNLKEVNDGYEGLLVVVLNYPPDGQPGEEGMIYLATQNLRVEKEMNRWVVVALDDFQAVEVSNSSAINWSCFQLPSFHYTGVYEDLEIKVQIQTVYEVDNWVYSNGFFGSSASFDLTPKPNAEFSQVGVSDNTTITHLGTQENRDQITHMGLSLEPVMAGEDRPEGTAHYDDQSSSGSSSDGTSWSNHTMEPGWGPVLNLYGGGSKFQAEAYPEELPEYYAADLYINHEFVTSMDLVLQEGGPK